MNDNLYGIWIGTNAVVAIAEDFRISFLRISADRIASILYHNRLGTIGVVYGYGKDFNAYAEMSIRKPDKSIFSNCNKSELFIDNHSVDNITYDDITDQLIYTMYDGTKFELILSEKIEMTEFKKDNKIDPTLSVSEKMAQWNRGLVFQHDNYYVTAGIDTKRYSIFFNLAPGGDGHAYCRVGQNGYCEKGWAMRSTVCIRHNETRMIADNLSSINEYKPILDCFVKDSCAFPPDGGWYWSLKDVTDDVIYLNGCNGETYVIHRV